MAVACGVKDKMQLFGMDLSGFLKENFRNRSLFVDTPTHLPISFPKKVKIESKNYFLDKCHSLNTVRIGAEFVQDLNLITNTWKTPKGVMEFKKMLSKEDASLMNELDDNLENLHQIFEYYRKDESFDFDESSEEG